MSDKHGLLSIGEMAKLTGAGIQALRYYERKNILRPAFIDPDSGYRYYSINQIYFVTMIMNCVEFGIPLKEVASVIDADDMTAYRNFMERSIKAIERKSKILKIASDGLKKALAKIDLVNQYNTGQIYQREFEEKIYYAKPCGQTTDVKNLISILYEIAHELYGDGVNRPADIDNLDDLIPLPDVGYLCQYAQGEAKYYGFGEMSKQFTHEKAIVIPGGTCFFRLDESSKIKEAPEIFEEQLRGRDSFMIIETEESLLGKTKVSQTMFELRLVL